MNLHEYQAKELLKKYNVPVQEGVAVETVDAAIAAYQKIATETKNKFAVVKAQIHANKKGLLLVNRKPILPILQKIYWGALW